MCLEINSLSPLVVEGEDGHAILFSFGVPRCTRTHALASERGYDDRDFRGTSIVHHAPLHRLLRPVLYVIGLHSVSKHILEEM
jgi:hypothetical protein